MCIKPLRQVVTATSDGALAATELEKYVAAMQRKTGLRADAPSVKQSETTVTVDTHESEGSDELFTKEMRQQLDTVFTRMKQPLLLKLYLDKRPISAELESFISALVAISDKLELEVCDRQAQETFAPCVEVCSADGTPTGLAALRAGQLLACSNQKRRLQIMSVGTAVARKTRIQTII